MKYIIVLALLLAGCAAAIAPVTSQCVPVVPYSPAFLAAAKSEMAVVRAQAPHVGTMVDDYYHTREQERACAKASIPKP